MREILTAPNPALLKKSKPVKEITPKIEEIAEALKELLGTEHDGVTTVSVAAPQIGENVRMFAYLVNPYGSVREARVIINPEIVSAKKFVVLRESCMSIPGKVFRVRRHKMVKIKGINIYGKYCSFRESGIVAQIFQHEINHLDGVLIDTIGEEVE